MLNIFLDACWPSACLLWRNIYLGHLPAFFFFCLLFLIGLFAFFLSCMSCLFILETEPLSVPSFANIFSQPEGCLPILLVFSFVVQKLVFHLAFVVVQLLSHVQPFATPWAVAHQASLSSTISQSLLKCMSIELVMISNHLIFCHSLLFLPSIFPNIRVFFNELAFCIRWLKYWNFTLFSSFIHVIMCQYFILFIAFPFYCWITFHCMDIPHFVHSSANEWVVLFWRLFPIFSYYEQCYY